MNRNRLIVVIIAGVVLVVVVVVGALALMGRTTTAAGPGLPGGTSTPTSVATSTPEPSATSDETDEGFDDDFGDTVVDVGDDGEAEFESGLEAELVTVKKTEVSGSGVGAANGPAYDIVIELTNDSSKKIDLSAVVVNAYTGDDRTPGTPAEADGSKPFAGSLAAGKSVRGHYFFGVAATEGVLRVTLSTSADSGLVVLEYR
jgi:hypothetical protein